MNEVPTTPVWMQRALDEALQRMECVGCGETLRGTGMVQKGGIVACYKCVERSCQTRVPVKGEPASESRPTKRLTGISGWHPDCYQRAVAYLTDPSGRLIVFDHVDVDAGTQVPARGIHEDESPEDAVRRELVEEAGLDHAIVVRKLGEAWNRSEPGNVPPGFEEQILHVFHLKWARTPAHEEWVWEEKSGCDTLEHRFAFRWVTLEEAKRVLWPAQAMWITALDLSLRHL